MTGETASANREIKLVTPMTPGARRIWGWTLKRSPVGPDRGTPSPSLGEGKRKFWRFLPSELAEWLAAKTNRSRKTMTRPEVDL